MSHQTILDHILMDWFYRRNGLRSAEFIDNNNVWYPMYGLGDTDASIMLIGQAPAFNFAEGRSDNAQRTEVNSSTDLEFAIDSDVEEGDIERYRTEWLVERLQSILAEKRPDEVEITDFTKRNDNRLGPLLVWLATSIETARINGWQLDNLYFTNLYKDGYFDEGENGLNRAGDLNRASREAWTPYLFSEIEHVEPDVIVTAKADVTKYLINGFDANDDYYSIIPSADGVGGKKTIATYHWSAYKSDEDNIRNWNNLVNLINSIVIN